MAQGSWAWIQFVDSPGGPVDPGYGRPPSPGHGHIDNTLPGQGGEHPSNRPPGSGEHPSHLPVWPIDSEHPIAPPIAGHPLPPIDPPPGTIWPPLPPGTDVQPGEKAVVLVAIEGVGYRYVVIEMGDSVDNELPGDGGEAPDNTLPGQPGHPANRPPGSGAPPRPDQGLPGGAPHPGNRPPGAPPPPRPGQGLPPAPQPKSGFRR